jgi:hypothetical protein
MRPGKKQTAAETDKTRGIRLDDDELDIVRSDPMDEYEELVEPEDSDDRRRDPLRH